MQQALEELISHFVSTFTQYVSGQRRACASLPVHFHVPCTSVTHSGYDCVPVTPLHSGHATAPSIHVWGPCRGPAVSPRSPGANTAGSRGSRPTRSARLGTGAAAAVPLSVPTVRGTGSVGADKGQDTVRKADSRAAPTRPVMGSSDRYFVDSLYMLKSDIAVLS